MTITIEVRTARYEIMKRALAGLLADMAILGGDVVGPSDASMRDVIGTAKTNARVLAAQLEAAYQGDQESFLVFPSPSEALETEGE